MELTLNNGVTMRAPGLGVDLTVASTW